MKKEIDYFYINYKGDRFRRYLDAEFWFIFNYKKKRWVPITPRYYRKLYDELENIIRRYKKLVRICQ